MVARFFASLAIVWVVFAACEHNPAGLDAPGPLASITVLPNPDTLQVGTIRQFVAVGKDARGNVVEVIPTWTVAAEGGSIGAGGLFTAGTVPGTYVNTVKASFAGISGFATVTVTVGPLSTITVTPDPANLVINATQTFTATGHDAFGNVVAITPTWSVAAGGGAIHGSSGLFTAGTVPGTYAETVVATSGSISGSATVHVTAGPLATITVTPDPATLGMGANQLFTAVGRDAGGNVLAITPTWSVVAGGGAIHGSSGLFTAGTLPGTYAQTVKATSGDISGFATVIVSGGALATITVTPDPANLGINGAQQFTATGRDAFGNVVAITPTWSVVAGGGVIDSGSGQFTAGTVTGTYTNTVKATSGSISGFATVNVSAGALATITVTPDPANLGVGAVQQFTAVGRDASGNVVAITPTWSVVASGGAIDAGSGLFTAGTVPGTYANTVQATSGGISGFATVTVGAGALASITVTPDPANLGVGATQQFTATGRDAFGNVVAFTPAWSSVAGGGTIDGSSGLFTAGTVPGTYTNTVKATSGGISGFATVTVSAGALATITITPTPVSLATTTSQQFTATGRDAFGNVVAITPTWTTAAGGGSTSATGRFTAGTVTGTYANTVVATSGGISGSATVTVVAGPLATITVTPDPASLAIGAAQQFTAVGRDASGNVVAITPTWSTVAGGGTIDAASGLFTAGTVPGTYIHTVAATSGGVSGFATVTVVAGPLATITVSPDSSDLGIGATQTFTAVGRDAAGNVIAVVPTWSVVASGGTIDAGSGVFTAGTLPGTYGNTVVATSGGISGSATVTVHAGALASITITPDPANLGIGATQQFTATGRDAFGNVVAITPVWSAVAGGGTIGAGSGVFTAGTLPGTFINTVRATSDGVAGFATVTVVAGPLATITVTPDPATVGVGATRQFTAVGRDAVGNLMTITPTWSIVADGGTINGSSGLFTAGGLPGTYANTVQATSGAISGTATVHVVAGPLASITVTPDPANLAIGAAQSFTAVGRDALGNTVAITPTWSVVAGGGTVNGSGLFTAGTVPGTYANTVQATSGGVSGSATVNVVAGPLATITVSPDPASLGVGAAQQFTAVGRDASGNVVAITPTWSVVAGGGIVNGTGRFTAGTAPGTFTNTVQATSGGVSGFATVIVSAGALASITVTPNPASLAVTTSQQFTATGRDAFGNVVALTPTWSVVAGGGTDNGSGLFTAGTLPGTYANTVKATSGGISGFATVNVLAGPLASITITPDPANVGIGATQTFTAVGRDASGNVVAVVPTWSVVAGGGTINSGSGLFTAGTLPGTFTNTVQATSGGVTGFATVTVSAGPLASIAITPDPANLGIGAAQQFTAVGRDASGNVVAITPTWSVEAGGGVIDSGSGLFTAGTLPGIYTNTVRATSGAISDFATVTVSAGALASITLTPDPANLGIGATQQFIATGKDAFGNVVGITPTWSVVASGGTVDSGSGLFTAGTVPGSFTHTVKATSGGISGFATVNVAAGPLATLTVSPDPADLGIGATQTFTAVGRDASGNVVAVAPTWSVVAGGGTIDGGSGLFTAGTTPGTYTNTVVATSGGVTGTATVNLVAGALATISVTPNPASLGVGASQQFTAVGRDASGNVIPITPSWAVVAAGGTIGSGSGLFTAGTLPGTYINTVKATSGGVSGFATVTVLPGPLASITVTPDPADLGIGAAQQFTATGKDAFGNVVAITPTWSVVAGGGTVDSGSGLFTAGTLPGTYANTVQATSGAVSGSATVSIVAGPLATITVSPNPASLGIGATRQFTAVGRDASGNVVPITPVWSVVAGGGSVASGSGLFTAGTLPGTYTNTVEATSGGVSGFATVNVFAGALASITVTPDPVGLAPTATQQFTATGRDASGNVVAITPVWSVVAGGGTVNSGSGLFTAGSAPGTYTNTVRATSGGISGFATVTVNAGALASITVTPNPATLASTASQQFTATGRDAFGNVVAVSPTWSVVAGGGLIDGVGLFTAGTLPGTFTNTVQATSGAISGFATVNVIAGALASITITPDPANLSVGAAQTFTAVGRDASGNVVPITPTWSVAAGGGTINSGSGVFTAGTVPGTYTNTVVATSGGISEFATVTVVAGPLATITVSPDPADLGIGATQTFTAVGRDASGNVVAVAPTWSVVAGGGTIDGGSGLFTAGTTPGTFTNTVVATSGGVTGTATVTLVAGPLASITVTPNPANLVIGAAQSFTAVGRDGSGNVIPITPTWSVVAGGGTVDSGSGLFTAGTLPGTFTNTVRAMSSGISGFATVSVAAGPLATITVTPNPASLGVGATRQFTAVGKDASGNVIPIAPTWSVVASGGTINSGSGLFAAGTVPGTFTNTVQATSGGISGRATVTVTAGSLATITVTPNPVSLTAGTSQQFTATGRDAFGNVLPITPTWSVVAGGGSSNASGLFTAGTVPGTYTNTVQATSGGVSGFATVTVVAGPLASITITPDPASLGIGAAQQFTATGRDAFGNVVAVAPTWSVVAGGGSVSGSGVFTAGTVPGTYTNTVQATSAGVSGFATVAIVAGPLATITVSPDPATLGVGGTRQFTAVGRDGSGNVVPITPTWSVVAGGGTINGSGLFTAGTAPGTYANTVQVTSDGVSGFATVTVTAGALASITVTPNPVSLAVTTTQQFTATGRDAFGNLVVITPIWSVVASGGTINGAGLFTAGTVPGTYTNTVRATSGGISGFATVSVNAGALATITVTPNPVTLASTASQQFTATGRDASGNVVAVTPTWSVVAGGGTIDGGSGLFTAGTAPGTYTNTVQATSGSISGRATVTVVAGPLASITITPDPANLGIGTTQTFTAVGRDASGNVVPLTPTWSVVAGGGTIDGGSGLFTAGTTPGTYINTVVATSGGISEFATVTIVAGPLASITVTPDPADLGIGATQTFTAVGRDASGNVVAVAPTWSVVAGGGTINSASGLFTAGTTPGTYTNTVVATSGAITGAATVTLVAGPLASITVTPNPASLVIGAAQTFTAVGRDGSGNVIPITPTWSVVAGGGTVDSSSGLFTAGTLPGTFTNTVRATSGGVSGFATVSVVAGPLATITVTPNPATVGVGATRQFTAVGKDASGNVIPITPTWSVVADGGTINASSGLFTAGTTPGTFTNTVQATSGAISGRATVTVVAGALASITVTPNPVSMAVTGTQTFTAVGRDAFGNVVPITPTWSVVSGGGTIDSGSGLFTAGTLPGTYTNTVQATSGGVSGLATVTVVAGPLATITVSPDPANLGIGASQQFIATGTDAFGNLVATTPTWSTVAGGGTINASGLFTAGTLPGTYINTVQATSNGVSGFATVAIVAGPLATITVSPDPATLSVTGTQQFTAVGRDASGNVVAITPTWSVVAGGGTIDSGSGLFTAGTLPGTYTNTVVATSGAVSGSATVIVSAGALATITVTPNPVTLAVATGQQFAATGADAFGNVVAITPTWSVVAGGGTISGAGLFTAGTVPGTYTNTVRAASGAISGSATVVVTAGALASITVTPNPASLVTGATQQFTATGRDAYANLVVITPTWSVVADGGTISASGLFTAGTMPGTYTNTVQATSGAISGFATVTVRVNLGAAATFALLGGSGASSCTGVSSVSGNVGVSPSGTISGFPSPCVILAPGDGTVHLNDPAAAAAQAAVTAANGTLSGMAQTANLTGQDLGGKTLPPGVYDFATSAGLTGTLTLDGPADGIWVFRTGTTLTTAADAKVTLAGGAQAGNVYWQIGSSATLGATNDAFQGTIIAAASITLGSGSKLIGRAFARAGAVTMVTNLITLP